MPACRRDRYLLLILFGSFQLLACLADLAWANDIGSSQTVSTASDLLLGFGEIASVSVLWLAFFPPRFYTELDNANRRGSPDADGRLTRSPSVAGPGAG